MALSTRNKINVSFNMASMTDIVFLLLIFFMLSSTLIAPNALKLLLPQSKAQTQAKAVTTVSITKNHEYYIETTPVSINDLETRLRIKLQGIEEPTISLHVDRSVPMEDVVKVMNIARDNRYKLILATTPY
jgi:biopolymer transport protein ExbD